MSKVTKNKRIKELERQVRGLTVLFSSLNTWSEYADNMLTELNHALPDPEYDAKCEAQEADVYASLDRHRERLGLNKPQLKQLDQSIFDGLDEKWRFAMVSSVGIPFVYDYKPTGKSYFLSDSSAQLMVSLGKVMRIDEYDYDTSDWQNSLIERDTTKEPVEVDLSSELTGSDLARAMLANASKPIMCAVSDISTSKAMSLGNYDLIHDYTDEHSFMSLNQTWVYAIPINNQGELLTQAEVGL